MGLFVATISLIQYSHLLMVRLAASLASEEFNALSSVLISFFFLVLEVRPRGDTYNTHHLTSGPNETPYKTMVSL